MPETNKTKKQLLLEAKKEKQLADLFNRCMRLMNKAHRKFATMPATH